MKKLFALLLTLALVLSLAACGGGDDDKTPSGSEDKTPSTSQQQTPSSKPDESKPAESQQQSTDSKPSDEELVKKANEIAATFGSYNGNALVWNVLTVDTENEKALLLTEKCIDIIPFHESDSAFTWESSEIRAWLGGEFYDNTFSDAEKALVVETINNNPANSETGIAGCDDTTDRVFLLSEKEALEYFETDDERLAETYDGDIFQWWLRTPGESESWFMLINDSGGLYYAGSTSNSSYGIRPAIWVNLSDEQVAPQQDGDPIDLSGYLGTKTGRFYSQFADGRMYMEYEMEMEGQKMTVISATDGEKIYSENKVDGASVGVSIIDGEDMYAIDHANKMVIKMSLQADAQTIAGAVLEESDVDMGDYKTGTREIDGKTYDTEEWIVEGASSIMCFDGDDLAYMIGAFEGEEVVMKIIEISDNVDDSLFKIPDDYTLMEM